MIQIAMKLTGVMDPLKVANVGDTPLDLQAGTAAGCGMVVGVLSGMHTRERLEKGPHTRLLESVAALPELLQ
jgi:phosphoglycolate phosphatase-like HAD superfamily hydrolase